MSDQIKPTGQADDFLSTLYDSLSDEAKEIMREVFMGEDDE
jgi:hypothetical protein